MRGVRPPVPAVTFAPRGAAGTGHALVLAPVLPVWDGGAFFAPVVRTLVGAGLAVTVADTLAAWEPGITSLAGLAEAWATLLPAFGDTDVLCGNALGGALAQALLGVVAPDTAVLLVSGPARSDAALDGRLTEIADLADAGHVREALDLLARRVLPDPEAASQGAAPAAGPLSARRPAAVAARPEARTGPPPHPAPHGRSTTPPPTPARATTTTTTTTTSTSTSTSTSTRREDAGQATERAAGRRLGAGLRLLCGADVTPVVRRHRGPLLNIVGDSSQLVGVRHTAAAAHHTVRSVAGCGMRPHTERPGYVARSVETFLHETVLREKGRA